MANPVRVFIADGHEQMRRGLRNLIESRPGFSVCGEAAAGREAFDQVVELLPDVLVLDVELAGLTGIEVTRRIAAALPGTAVLIHTVQDSEATVRLALQAGARGYVLKSDAGTQLLAAIESLSRGEPWFNSLVSRLLLESYLKAAPAEQRPAPVRVDLTAREREILGFVAGGRKSREIAEELGLSIKTIETHRANVMSKLGAHSIAELIRYAIRARLVSLNE